MARRRLNRRAFDVSRLVLEVAIFVFALFVAIVASVHIVREIP